MIIRFLKYIKNRLFYIKINSIKKTFKCAGKNFYISKGFKLKGNEYIEIGDDFYAGPNCRIEAWDNYEGENFMPQIIIGHGVKINSQCHVGCINKIIIGNNCLFGSYVFVTDHSHGNSNSDDINIHPVKRHLYSKGEVIIEDDCWLCESCVILPNVRIGHNSIVGANAVVTSDVPPYSIAVGNPAVVKPINKI